LTSIGLKLDSITQGTCDIIAFSLLNFSWFPEYRGKILKEGGLKVLLSMCENASNKGQEAAAHALAKIAITTNPHIAFKNGMEYNIIPPLMQLTRSDEPLQQFEALMALTNLADLDHTVRTAIAKDKGRGLEWIESVQLTDDVQIRRAASELLCNLIPCDYVVEQYHAVGGNQRMKLWYLFSQCDDFATQRACTGALATLSEDIELCKKINEQSANIEVYLEFIVSDSEEIQHRALVLVKNLVRLKEIAQRIYEKDELVYLIAAEKSQNPDFSQIASQALTTLQDHGFSLPPLPVVVAKLQELDKKRQQQQAEEEQIVD